MAAAEEQLPRPPPGAPPADRAPRRVVPQQGGGKTAGVFPRVIRPTPRVPPPGGVDGQDGSDPENRRGNAGRAGGQASGSDEPASPEPPPRAAQGTEQTRTVAELDAELRKEYLDAEQRAFRDARAEAFARREMRRRHRERAQCTVRDYYAEFQRLHEEDIARARPQMPDDMIRAGASSPGEYLRAYELLTERTDMRAQDVREEDTETDATSTISTRRRSGPAPPPGRPPPPREARQKHSAPPRRVQRTKKKKDRNVLDDWDPFSDILADDDEWQEILRERRHEWTPQDLQAARLRHIRRRQEEARMEQRSYLSVTRAELGYELFRAEVISQRASHQRALNAVWREHTAALWRLRAARDVAEWRAAEKLVGQDVERERQAASKSGPAQEPPPAASGGADDGEWDAQRSSWQMMYERPPSAGTQRRRSDGGEEARRWLAVWREETPWRHEAALRMQLAWRCFLAKRRVRWAAVTRSVRIRADLAAEESREAELEQRLRELRWRRMQHSEHREDAAARRLQRFCRYCHATTRKRELRRARAAAERAKRREHAATCIQAVWRGLLGRMAAEHKRNPSSTDWRQRLFQSRHATRIQRIWRGWATRRRLRRRRAAACAIQRAARVRQGRSTRRRLDRASRERDWRERQEYAARVVTRAMLRYHRTVGRSYRAARCIQSMVRSAAARQRRRERALGVAAAVEREAAAQARAALVSDEFTERWVVCEAELSHALAAGEREAGLSFLHVRCREGARRLSALAAAASAGAAVSAAAAVGATAEKAREGAALTMQCAWRSHAARQEVGRRRAQRAERDSELRRIQEDHAARVIQAAFRIPGAKREVGSRKRQRRSSDERHADEMHQRMRDGAATAIQSCWRLHRARKLRDQRRAGKVQKQQGVRQGDAALVLELAWRCCRSRHRVSASRRERRRQLEAVLRTERAECAMCIQRAWRRRGLRRTDSGVRAAARQEAAERRSALEDRCLEVLRSEAAESIQRWQRLHRACRECRSELRRRQRDLATELDRQAAQQQ